jgi:hypothetical protein
MGMQFMLAVGSTFVAVAWSQTGFHRARTSNLGTYRIPWALGTSNMLSICFLDFRHVRKSSWKSLVWCHLRFTFAFFAHANLRSQSVLHSQLHPSWSKAYLKDGTTFGLSLAYCLYVFVYVVFQAGHALAFLMGFTACIWRGSGVLVAFKAGLALAFLLGFILCIEEGLAQSVNAAFQAGLALTLVSSFLSWSSVKFYIYFWVFVSTFMEYLQRSQHNFEYIYLECLGVLIVFAFLHFFKLTLIHLRSSLPWRPLRIHVTDTSRCFQSCQTYQMFFKCQTLSKALFIAHPLGTFLYVFPSVSTLNTAAASKTWTLLRLPLGDWIFANWW